MTVGAIVPAAGSGSRLGLGTPKALVAVNDKPLVVHTIEGLRHAGVDLIVIPAPAEHIDAMTALFDDDVIVVEGGADRQASVRAGLARISDDIDHVLVHDAARCLTPPEMIARVLHAVAAGANAVIPVLPLADTIRTIDEPFTDGRALAGDLVDRSVLWRVQTPQGFQRSALVAAHGHAHDTGAVATDDAALVAALGLDVVCVPGDERAMKITTAADLRYADFLQSHRTEHA